MAGNSFLVSRNVWLKQRGGLRTVEFIHIQLFLTFGNDHGCRDITGCIGRGGEHLQDGIDGDDQSDGLNRYIQGTQNHAQAHKPGTGDSREPRDRNMANERSGFSRSRLR